MTGRSARRLVIATLAVALVAASCGDDDAVTTTTAAPGTTTAATTSTTAAPGTTAASTTTTPPIATVGDADVDELLARFRVTPLRATYVFGEGADETLVVLSQDPTQDPPVDVVILLGPPPGGPEEARVLTIGEQVIFCGPAGEGCFESPAGIGSGTLADGILGPIVSGFLVTANAGGTAGLDLDPGGATIGGRTGICFTYTPDAVMNSDMDFIRQCIDAELGFTLLIEGQEAGGSAAERVMELVEFGDPLPDDFEPTGPVTAAPGS